MSLLQLVLAGLDTTPPPAPPKSSLNTLHPPFVLAPPGPPPFSPLLPGGVPPVGPATWGGAYARDGTPASASGSSGPSRIGSEHTSSAVRTSSSRTTAFLSAAARQVSAV